MHEMVLAKNLLVAIRAEAEKHRGRPAAAKVSWGPMLAVNSDALAFAFEAISRGTPCEGMSLEIELRPPRASCCGCGRTLEAGAGEDAFGGCPDCGSFEIDTGGYGMVLESIEFLEQRDGED